MKSFDLYEDDSSDEEINSYSSEELISKLASQKQNPFLLSLLMHEISQSIIEQKNITEAYHQKKQEKAKEYKLEEITQKHLNSKEEKSLRNIFEILLQKFNAIASKQYNTKEAIEKKDEIDKIIQAGFSITDNMFSNFCKKIAQAVGRTKKEAGKDILSTFLKDFVDTVIAKYDDITIKKICDFEIKIQIPRLLKQLFCDELLRSGDELNIKTKISDAYKILDTNTRIKTSETSESKPGSIIDRIINSYTKIVNKTEYIEELVSNGRPNKTFGSDPQEWLSNFKLDHKIVRGKIKLSRDTEESDEKSNQSEINGAGYGRHVNETNKFSVNGARTDLIAIKSGGFSYKNIQTKLQGILAKQSVKDILISIIQAHKIPNVDFLDKPYLCDITYLLFKCETERNISAFLTNAMFFDLVEFGKYKITDLFDKMPMAMRGAVSGARYLLDQLGGKYGEGSTHSIKRQHYDFGESDKDNGIELATRDVTILIDWLILKNIIKDQKFKYSHLDSLCTEQLQTKQLQLSQILQTLVKIKNKYDDKQKAFQGKPDTGAILDKIKEDYYTNISNILVAINSKLPFVMEKNNIDNNKSKAIFKAFHNLVYEWYGIRLDWLYSFDDFVQDKDVIKDFKDEYIKMVENHFNKIISNHSDLISFTWKKESKNFILDKKKSVLPEGFDTQSEGNITNLMYLVNMLRCVSDHTIDSLKKSDIAQKIELKWDEIINSWSEISKKTWFKNYVKESFDSLVKKKWNSQNVVITNKSSTTQETTEHSKVPDVHAADNAFNKADDQSYLYQGTDIAIISNQIMEFQKVQWVGAIGVGNKQLNANTILQESIIKPIVGVYNIGNFHWVSFCIKQIDGVAWAFYKDSLNDGSVNDQFKKLVLEKYNIAEANIIAHISNEQTETDKKSCGIFALSNAQFMADQHSSLKQEDFSSMKFNTQENVDNLRSSEYKDRYFDVLLEKTINEDVLLPKIKLKLRQNIYERKLNEIKDKLPTAKLYDADDPKFSVKDEMLHDNNLIIYESIIVNTANQHQPFSLEELGKARITTQLYIGNNVNTIALGKTLGIEDIDNKIESVDGYKKFIIDSEETYCVGGDHINKAKKEVLHDTNLDLVKKVKEQLNNELKTGLDDKYITKIQERCTQLQQGMEGNSFYKEKIDGINSYFTKYTLDGLSNILKLRLDDLDINNASILECKFTNIQSNNIEQLVYSVSANAQELYLVPVNLHGKHAVGLVIKKNCNSIRIKYFDSENKPIPTDLLNALNLAFATYHDKLVDIHFEQIEVEQQKYANCGVEVVENFIKYLTSSRVSQEKAIELHSKLVENALLHIESRHVHKFFEELENNHYSPNIDSEPSQHDDIQLHNFDYDNHQSDLLGQGVV